MLEDECLTHLVFSIKKGTFIRSNKIFHTSTVDGLIFVEYQFSWKVRSTKSSSKETIFCINDEGKCYSHEF